MTATLEMGKWFAEAYPPHPEEARYRYASASSLKATIVDVDNSKVTKIPGFAKVSGDIRMTPFYDIDNAVAKVGAFVESLNERILAGSEGDPLSRFRASDGRVGHLTFVPKTNRTSGMACDLESRALKELSSAILKARGEGGLHPWAMTGSLPLVRDLQRQGYDIQITGFGRSVAYHAPNEFGTLQDFAAGYEILQHLVEHL
jgi:acetylornithine deacetylase/succinyl-diaminopimelate desuccinylase-like protein